MKLYQINKKISLGFLTPQDQYDMMIDPEKNEVQLMFDGKDIYLMQKSITMNHAIDLWLKDGTIEEIK